MTDEQKTKEQLMEELAVLRQNFSQLEKLVSQQQAETATLQQQTHREQLITQIAGRIRQSLDLQEILQIAVKEVQEFLQAERVFVYRFQADWSGVVIVESSAHNITSILGRTITDTYFADANGRRLYEQNRIQAIADIYTAGLSACHLDLLANLGVRANLVVPILQGEQLWGLLIANQCQQPRQWQQWEIDLLQQLATQLSIAIQQSQLYERTQQLWQKEQALNRVIQSIHNSLDLDTIFSTAVKEIAQLIQAQQAVIVQYLPQQQVWLHITEYRQSLDIPTALGTSIPDIGNKIAERLKRLEVVQLEDPTNFGDEINSQLAQTYGGAWLLIPLYFNSQVWGSLSLLRNKQSPPWQQEEIELTKTVADQLSIAIKQFTLVAQLQTELIHRQQAEATVQQEQHLVQKIVETTPEIIYIYDLIKQHNVYINHRMADILGYNSYAIQTMKEQVLPNLIHPDDIDRVNAHLQSLQSLQDGEVVEIEYRMKHNDGNWRWLHSRECVFTRNSNGLPVQILGTASDITKRKQSQREIHFQAGLLSAVEQAIIATDLQGIIIYWNRFAETLYGWLADEVKQKNIVDLISPVTSLKYATEIMSQLKQGKSWTGEFIVQHKNGTTFPALVTDSPIYDEQGTLIGIVGISKDITEQRNAITRLQESEERFRNMADTSPVMIWMSDTDTLCQYFNKSWLEFTGRTLQQEIGNGWTEGVHPEDLQFCLNTYITAFNSRQDFAIEYRVRRNDGQYRWILDAGSPRIDAHGNFVGYIGSGIDITERRQALEALQEGEARLKLALEAACMCTWDWDILNNQITYSNKDNFISKLAPNFSPSTYQTFLNGIHPQDRERVATEVMNAINHEANYDTEFRVLIDEEEILWLGSKGQVFYDQSGKAIRMVGVLMDISERKQAEIKIHQQATLLDIATDAILVQDLNNQILFWNQSAKHLYGWLEQEAIGQNAVNLLFNSEESLQLIEEIHAALVDKGFWQGEINQLTKEGKKIIVESRWTLVRDEQGQPKSFLVSNTDITQKKQIESQFLRAQRLESIGILASGIAHDLNNVLSPILMSLQLLEKKFSDKQTQQLIKILDTNVQRGADLIKQVLSFAKGVSGKLIILPIKQVVAEIHQIIQQTFPKSISFTTELPLDLWAVYADPTQLQQVLMNLCINARDAMPYGGSLKVSAANKFIDELSAQSFFEAKAGYYIVISVVDTGTGIAPEILERIFEPFFTTKETGKGTGLGLSTVMGIVKNYGGFINVESSLCQGSQFQVYLPAITSTQQHQQVTQDSELLTGNGESILVVDDELSLQEITQISLADYNYQVLTASNGIEALSLYVKHKDKISAVLMDLMMPEMDGITAIHALRRINPRIKIIATSGLATNEKINEVSSIGVKAFLPKPYTLSELLKTLSLVFSENENISD